MRTIARTHPLAVFLLLGLGITALSVAPSFLPEIKKVIRSVPAVDARQATNLRRNGFNRCPQGGILATVFEHHAHRTLTHSRGKLV